MPNIHSTISFGLVNIPVIINPIIKNNDTSFNQIHAKCGKRIKYIKYCPYCKKEVKEKEILKGYQYEKDNYLVFKKEELEKLKLTNDKLIEIIAFIKLTEIEPIYFEKSYFLDTESKSKAYMLFCEALNKTRKVALAKTILSSKFYYCILRFTLNGIILTTLYFAEEITIPDKKLTKVNDKELTLAIKLINNLTAKFTPTKYKDEYQDNIKKAIDDKLNGKKIKAPKKKSYQHINDLMTALERSLKSSK